MHDNKVINENDSSQHNLSQIYSSQNGDTASSQEIIETSETINDEVVNEKVTYQQQSKDSRIKTENSLSKVKSNLDNLINGEFSGLQNTSYGSAIPEDNYINGVAKQADLNNVKDIQNEALDKLEIENCLLTNGNITELLKNVTKLDLSSKTEHNTLSKNAGNSKGDLKSIKDSLNKKSNGVKTPKDPIPGFTEFSNLRETLL